MTISPFLSQKLKFYSFISMLLGMILRAALPKVYGILTGERGLKTILDNGIWI